MEIGDLKTELTLLDPLTKSVLQYCRLLVSDDYLKSYKIRSLEELKLIWEKEHNLFSHIIFIGHGSGDDNEEGGIIFPNKKIASPSDLASIFEIKHISSSNVAKKVFLSLCCKTAYKKVAKPFSQSKICEYFIAPLRSVHGAVASQYVQTFLAYNLLQGENVPIAFRHACITPDGTVFRLWEKGRLSKRRLG
ncbi:MAG: hypothetical protein Q4A62_00055 [Eikenella sp.]|nr:hypothetical protein [Eikenella sp.]